jgi:hypothetical protein
MGDHQRGRILSLAGDELAFVRLFSGITRRKNGKDSR